MELVQYWFTGLAQASYLLVDDGDAVVVDPSLDVEQYVEAAAARRAAIRHVVETHLHADFVSGHTELAEATGARVWMGAGAAPGFPSETLADGSEIRFGSRVLRALATPGHTPESVTLVVPPRAGAADGPPVALTGDTLFVGDVGRPDLAAGDDVSPADMARDLWSSLTTKLLTLPDATLVYPAHGAGSLCGKALGGARSTTIGAERIGNAALAVPDEEAFVRYLTSDLPPQPAYFRRAVEVNRRGPLARAEFLAALRPLSVEQTEGALADGAIVVDTREPEEFAAGHVPGAINIGLSDFLGPWAGTVVPLDRPVVLCVGPGTERAAALEFLRVGFDPPRGWLAGGFPAWRAAGRPVERLGEVPPARLADVLGAAGAPRVLDVRTDAEWEGGHLRGAEHVPLSQLPRALAGGSLDAGATWLVVCGSGYRSAIAASLLARAGARNLAHVPGGMTEVSEEAGGAALCV